MKIHFFICNFAIEIRHIRPCQRALKHSPRPTKNMEKQHISNAGQLEPRRSIVTVGEPPRRIGTDQRIVMLGSCFAQYMGERLAEEGYATLVNPTGTLFNPFSIGITIRQALHPTPSLPCFAADGEWRCWWANTRFKAPTQDELEDALRQVYGTLGEWLRTASHLVITLGTNVCYKTAETIVTNCQRQPDRLFTEWRASLHDVVDELQSTMQQLLTANPSLQIIFTVSPYRYHKYGYHGSQLSKAILLLAEEELTKTRPTQCVYFPAYEILLDELRDYSYYAPDGHHPGPNAVTHIWQRFKAAYVAPPASRKQ